MLERSLEIVCVMATEKIFGAGWRVVMQQQSIRSVGRLDLLLADPNENRHVIELKKGAATTSAINQVIRYRDALKKISSYSSLTGWILANSIPSDVAIEAEKNGVRYIDLPLETIDKIKNDCNISESDLIGPRKKCGVLYSRQGTRSSKSITANEIAFATSPAQLVSYIKQLESDPKFIIDSLKVQSTIFYRGIKIGGINRQRNVGYISVGVVISTKFENELFSLGFTTGHDPRGHDWYEISLNKLDGMKSAVRLAANVINNCF
jgi:Endonuclease NucS